MLSCNTRTVGGQSLVTVTGEIDMSSKGQFWDALRPSITPDAAVVIDGSGIDSSGLGVLILTHHRTHDAGAHLYLAAPSAPLRRLLEGAGVDGMFVSLVHVPTGYAGQPLHLASDTTAA